jgi:hypothetical protein
MLRKIVSAVRKANAFAVIGSAYVITQERGPESSLAFAIATTRERSFRT